MKNILDGDFQATKFLLSTKGKERGYSEKQIIEHTGDSEHKQLNINIMQILAEFPDAKQKIVKMLEDGNVEESKEI